MSRRVGRRGHSPAFRASVVAAITAGGQHRTVARLYGVSAGTISIWCQAAGVSRTADYGKPPTCHPSEVHYGRGLCRRCYRREWERNGHVATPSRRAA